ncbi:MAG: triose-phosphate isomerase [Spirochaetes bacterium]|nr:triose-phosphate isomerase [Spirochaetota bacterium]
MAKREIFSGNWKMYKTYDEAVELVNGIKDGMPDTGGREVIVFPPAVYLRDLVKLCKGSGIEVGIQNMYFEKEGAFTGEISPLMAKDTGVRYALIGHSERRHVFRETDGDINKKVKAAFEFGLEPVLCVGELLEEREAGNPEDVVNRQLELGLKDVSSEQMSNMIIAYEPVWAIGTGKVATPEIADTMHKTIRRKIGSLYSSETAEILPVLYGGSVKPENIADLYSRDNIDGVLVGGASLKINSFLDIIHVNIN